MATTTTTNSDPEQIVVEEIRRVRHSKGWTQEQLAVKARCSVTMLGQIERGVVPRRGYVVDRVLRVLAA